MGGIGRKEAGGERLLAALYEGKIVQREGIIDTREGESGSFQGHQKREEIMSSRMHRCGKAG